MHFYNNGNVFVSQNREVRFTLRNICVSLLTIASRPSGAMDAKSKLFV